MKKIIDTIKMKSKKILNEFKISWGGLKKADLITFKLMFLVILLFFISFEVYTFSKRGLVDFLIANVIILGSILIGALIASLIYVQIKKIPVSVIYYLVTAIIMLSIIFTSNRSEIGNYVAIAVTILFLILFIYGIKSIILIVFYKRKVFSNKISILIFSVMLIITSTLFTYIYFTDGLKNELKTNANETLVKSDVTLENYSSNNFGVIKGVYGNEAYLDKYEYDNEEASIDVSISHFLSKWNKTREKFLGYNVYNFPLNGQFFVPKEEGKYPLVLISHGNHEMIRSSEIGYNYLGEFLASQGYIVVSLDENALNYSTFDNKLMLSSLGNENDARAYVMLKHVEKLLDSQNDKTSVFYNKIDEENIALIGHSRGGEAVSIASLFNNIKYLPNDYRKRLNYGLNIKSIIGMSPTDMQYQPGNRPVYLENVNYLLLHGSNDMDVYYLAGSNQYERIRYTNGEDYFKAQVYIYGANHGQFNETWTKSDTSDFAGLLHNTTQLISREEQEQIAKEVIYCFLESTLKNKDKYEEVFKNISIIDEHLPDTLYVTQYHSSNDQIICDYNEDIFLETTTIKGGSISVKNLNRWREGTSYLEGKTSHNYGVFLGWDNGGSTVESNYVIDFDETNLKIKRDDSVFLSVADTSSDSKELIDFTVRIKDKNGFISNVSLSEYSKLQNMIEMKLSKFYLLEKENKPEVVFQTFELPIELFMRNNGNIDLDSIVSVSLVFDRTRKASIMVKDIGIRHTN